MENQEFVNIFRQFADSLELKNDNPFKVRAYRRAAQVIESLNKNITDIYRSGGIKALEEIPGIGEHIAQKIEEKIKTGKVQALNELAKEFPKDFLSLVEIPGLGPKTALLLFKKLKIDSMAKLEKAAKAGKLDGLPGMGKKKVANILQGIQLKKKSHGRFLLDDATAQAEMIVDELQKLKDVTKILPCGSLRRGQETIGDLDILIVSEQPETIMNHFVKLSAVQDVLAKGKTKSSVVLKNGMQTDLRVVEEKSFGSAAHYFTGSKDHNIAIRIIAQKKGLKVSEYGIFKGEKQIAGKTEEEFYKKMGLQYIPPELRENRGELELAKQHKIPELVELNDIKGDLHLHTTASDGHSSIAEMAAAAKNLGHEYIAITDHSQSTRIAHGLKNQELLKHIKEIKAVAKKITGIKVLAGSEVDILPNGELDYPDELLAQLDIVLVSIHSNFKMPRQEMTKRIVKALSNPHSNILTHPTGRLIGEREPYEVDMEAVLQAAREQGKMIEVNAHPKRLDLTDIFCMRAKELGVKIVVSTDAHAADQLNLMRYGVITARRGWLEAKDVANTLPLAKLEQLL